MNSIKGFILSSYGCHRASYCVQNAEKSWRKELCELTWEVPRWQCLSDGSLPTCPRISISGVYCRGIRNLRCRRGTRIPVDGATLARKLSWNNNSNVTWQAIIALVANCFRSNEIRSLLYALIALHFIWTLIKKMNILSWTEVLDEALYWSKM